MDNVNLRISKRSTLISKVGRYVLSKTIGKGNFAIVRRGKHEIAKTKVAVKIIDKCRLTDEDLKKVRREVEILKRLKHQHVIRLYEVIESSTHIFLVTEYASGGEVFDYLRKKRMNEREARQVFRQVVSAVAYCHASGVVHRDLKAENLLFASLPMNNIKLVDFGFSNFFDGTNLLQTWCGSPPYAAPELFKGESYDGIKADIWSMGVILYILVCGGFPFPSTSIERLRKAVCEGHINIPFFVSAECADLIRKMLQVDPNLRINTCEIIQHPWFTGEDYSESLELLFRKSICSNYSVETESLNPSCIIYMQQRGYSADKISQSVAERRFDDEYATYFLLYEKLGKEDLPGFNSILTKCDQALLSCTPDDGRRGSRGSLTTGKAVVENGAKKPLTISAADLVKLGLSSGEEDSSVSSDSECNSEATSTFNMHDPYLAQRRHTVLGVPGLNGPLFAQPSASGNFGNVPPVTFPLVENWAEMSNLADPFSAFLKAQRFPIINQTAFTPLIPYVSLDPFNLASNCYNGFYDQRQQHSTSTVATNDAENNVEEMGARYLKSRGNLKRHTFHGSVETTPKMTVTPKDMHQSSSTSTARHNWSSLNQSSCRSRSDPYRPPLTRRRGSDSTQLMTPDMLNHLQQIYNTACAPRAESPFIESMRRLPQEFQQLRATNESLQSNGSELWRSSPRASPPSLQSLHMIVEHNDEMNPPTGQSFAKNNFPFSHTYSSPLLENAPEISVTDHSGGTTMLSGGISPMPSTNLSAAHVDDPLSSFQTYTNSLLYQQQSQQHSSPLDSYFYSMPEPSNNEATMDGNENSFFSSKKVSDIYNQLKYVLHSMSSEVFYNEIDNNERANAIDNGDRLNDSNNHRRCVSLKSVDGTQQIEINVFQVEFDLGALCRVDFRRVLGERHRCEMLCSQVLAGLKL